MDPLPSDKLSPEILDLFAQTFGRQAMGSFLLEQVADRCEQYGEPVVKASLCITMEAGVKNFRYFDAVCKGGGHKLDAKGAPRPKRKYTLPKDIQAEIDAQEAKEALEKGIKETFL